MELENFVGEIEAVVAKRVENGQVQYEVTRKENGGKAWYPAHALFNFQPMIRDFERKSAVIPGELKSHSMAAVARSAAKLDHRFRILVEGQIMQQQLMAEVVPRVVKVEEGLVDHDRRLTALEVEREAREREGAAAARVPKIEKVPCGKCGKLLSRNYVKRHMNQDICGRRAGRPPAPLFQE